MFVADRDIATETDAALQETEYVNDEEYIYPGFNWNLFYLQEGE